MALFQTSIAHGLSSLYFQKRGHPHEIVLRLCQLRMPWADLVLSLVPGAPRSSTLLTEMVWLCNQ